MASRILDPSDNPDRIVSTQDGVRVTAKLFYKILNYWALQDDEVFMLLSDLSPAEQKIVLKGITARRTNARLHNWKKQYIPKEDNNDSNTSKPRNSTA